MGAQRILMSVRASGTTDMIVQVTVPKTTADYGVLIPVPSEPTLDSRPVSSQELDMLDRMTAPLIDIPYEESSGIGCACAGGDDDAPRGPSDGVIVGNTATIGPVVAVSLTGDNADAVGAWLTEHGFLLPSSDMETLAQYVGAGNYFIAVRRSEGDGGTVPEAGIASSGPTSVGIHYTLQGDHRKLSLGFTKMGAPPLLAFTLFIAAPQATGPSAPFAAITLNDLDATMLQHHAYSDAVRVAVASHGSKAFVLEGTSLKSNLSSTVGGGITQFMDDGAVVTRATTVVDRSQVSDDVVFATPFSGEIPKRRSASVSHLGARYASIGLLGIAAIAHTLRRRGRER